MQENRPKRPFGVDVNERNHYFCEAMQAAQNDQADVKLTPKQVAQAIGVSESSLKRWCDKGLLPTQRTAGGHRRLPLNGVLKFLRDNQYPLVRPDLLGLPPATTSAKVTWDRAQEAVVTSLERGDEAALRRAVFDLYLAGNSVVEICDRVLARAFHELGDKWHHGSVEIYQERRGVEITLRMLWELNRALPDPQEGAPIAFGGTLQADRYSIPTTMVELALREAGWEAKSYGTGHPVPTLRAALKKERPRLFWLSVSHIEDVEEFVEQYTSLYECAQELEIPVVVGGRGLTDALRKRVSYSAFCDTLDHAVNFARNVHDARPATFAARHALPA